MHITPIAEGKADISESSETVRERKRESQTDRQRDRQSEGEERRDVSVRDLKTANYRARSQLIVSLFPHSSPMTGFFVDQRQTDRQRKH